MQHKFNKMFSVHVLPQKTVSAAEYDGAKT